MWKRKKLLIVIAEQGIVIVAKGKKVKYLRPAWEAMLLEDAEPCYKGKVLSVLTVRVLRERKKPYYGR